MTVTDFSYPVLCFNQGIMEIMPNEDTLTTSNKLGLRRAWYKGLLVIDTHGTTCKVRDAKKLHGVGWFGGYNLFLNQRIKVELVFEGPPFQMSVEEVRQRVLDSFKRWSGWKTRDDFDELKAAIEHAPSIPEVIRLLT